MSYIDGDNVLSLYGSVLFKSVSLRGWIVVVLVPNLNVECLVSANQQLEYNKIFLKIFDFLLSFTHKRQKGRDKLYVFSQD